MPLEGITKIDLLRRSDGFQTAKKQFLESVMAVSAEITQVKPASPSDKARESYLHSIQKVGKDRGRDLYYPFLASGLGSGPLVELADGSVKFDMITGIGIHFFGHTHPLLMEEVLTGISSDIMQGNLEPGIEMKELSETILSRVGVGSRLKHAWITCSGTMENEIALKIIRQKKAPATKILAIRDCFAGRSTAMQELTDNPSYRQGQPVYGEAQYLPFYDSKLGLERSIEATLAVFKEHLSRHPGKFAGLMIEIVQGEGGFYYAPREFYVRLDEAKKAGLAVWVDEVQTFGRTGELFAYQKFSLNEYIDVVTIGKMLQACMVLFTEEYNPKPGLVAGTFSGSTVALRTGRRIVEMLTEGGYLGPQGKIEKLSAYFAQNIQRLSEGACRGMIGEYRAIGGMIAFVPFQGTMDDVKKVLMRLFDLGVVAFYCGHGPYLVRMLPPLGVMNEYQIDQVCSIIETALNDVKRDMK